MWIWSLTLALGAEPVPEAWHHFERSRFEEAMRDASAILEEDPANLEAHRVYLTAMQRHDYRTVVKQEPLYRAWHEANPDDPVARFARAHALHIKSRGADCDEAAELLEPLPDDPTNRYSALRIKQQWSQCDSVDKAGIDAALRALGPDAGPAADSYGLWMAAREGDWDAVRPELDGLFEAYPQRVSSIAGAAWATWDGAKPAPKDIQQTLLDWGKGWPDTTDPIVLDAQLDVLRSAGHAKHDKGREHQETVDPAGEARATGMSKVLEKIIEANKKPTHELALAALEKVGPKVPEDSEERATWHYYMQTRLQALEDEDGLFALAAERARTNPDDPSAVNDWAYECAVRGVQLEEAEAAMARVLPLLDADRAPGSWDYGDWVDDRLWTHAAYADTQGWLLHLLGRDEEAAEVLVRAAQFADDPTIAGHTGLVLKALGDDEDAWPYLVRAADPEGTGEEALDAAVHDAVTALWPAHRSWHPGGMDGWLAAHHAASEPAPEASETDVSDGPDYNQEHPLMGEAFPYEQADKLGGGTLKLTGHDGLTVVDMWATWCGPCVQGMPHLQEVAEAYADRGVRVVGLSVDQQVAPVTRFFKEVDPEAIGYELGHVGAGGMAEVQVRGIPSLFVLDKDGAIAAYISGYGPGDTRLERALDAILASDGRIGAPGGPMHRHLLALSILALAPAAQAQIVPTGPFTGSHSETWVVDIDAPCIPFGNGDEVCSTNMLTSSGWSFMCSVSPRTGTYMTGSSSGTATYDFGTDLTRFGMYVENHSDQTGAGQNITMTAYDAAGNLLGSEAVFVTNCGGWTWLGIETQGAGIASVDVAADQFTGAFVLMDDVELDAGNPNDQDGDGFDPATGDCDDGDPNTYPGAPELCDGVDNDCDGSVPVTENDGDGDGSPACEDCDDANPGLFPGAVELCDGIDNDCDGVLGLNEVDGDGDGITECDGDCNNADPFTYPGAAEICDGVDNDCDGSLGPDETDDDGDGVSECNGDCDDTDPATNPQATEICDGLDNDCDGGVPAAEFDDDLDGYRGCDGDCDDTQAGVNPAATEVCDGFDTDCDGVLATQETDADGDGFAPCEDDCDDNDPSTYPGATEITGDGIDQDCDGADLPGGTGTGTATGGTATGGTATGGTATGATGTGTGDTTELPPLDAKGCGCTTSGSLPLGPWFLLPFLLGLRRDS